MGQGSGGLSGVTKRAQERSGTISITGRYHRLPKRLEDDYQAEKTVLGSGYNGQVHLAKNRQTGAKVAVKGFKLNGVSDDKRRELESEAEIFLGMDHPHVCRLVDVYESEDQLSLVMECMTGGELFKRILAKKTFTEKDAADASWQMLLAVNYIHSHKVVHRDIKLENFLYDNPDSNHLKLIDFGFSKIWTANTKMALSCGTLAYVAPEVLDQSYTSQCDMWSLGVTVFILLFGYMPFSGSESNQMVKIKQGNYQIRADAWDRVSSTGQNFVKSLLMLDPTKRLTAEQALAHSWIAERETHSRQCTSVDQGILSALVAFSQASTFRRTAMSLMAWSLTNEERSKVRQAFIEMDENRTGTITLGEFKKVVEEKFHIQDEAAKIAFEALDINHSDEIHYSEFLAAMVSSRITIHDDLLKATFKRFDTDNSGFITVENLKQVLGESFKPEEVTTMMQEVDRSQDGQISYQEFIAYLREGDGNLFHQESAAKVIDKMLKDKKDQDIKMRQRTSESLRVVKNVENTNCKACCSVQ